MIPLPLFIACMTGPVALCTPLMGPHNASVATGWVGSLNGVGVWKIRRSDGTFCQASTPAGEYAIWQQACRECDADGDGDVDLMDFGTLQRG